MLNGAERILVDEPFFIKDSALELPKPVLAIVTGVKEIDLLPITGEPRVGQRVWVRPISPPRAEFEFRTDRTTGPGIYIDRYRRRFFYRVDALNIEEIAQFFNNLKQVPEEIVRGTQKLFDDMMHRSYRK